MAVVAVDQLAEGRVQRRQRLLGPGLVDGVDALAHTDATGHLQWLLAIYRRGALAAALAALPRVRDVSVRRLVADLAWHPVGPGAEHVGDVDTWADLADWEGRTGSATMGRHRPELEG